MTTTSPKVWFVTGCSTGVGREVSLAALNRGDKVIATARNIASIQDLKSKGASILALDLTSDESTIQSVAADAMKIHGHIDILLNNAGYCLNGAVEESTYEDTLKLYDTNVLGPLKVTRAFLPYLREQKFGVIANIGSIGARYPSMYNGIYCGTKAAIASISGALMQEVKPYGLEVTCLELGVFRTKILSAKSVRASNPMKEYDDVMSPVRAIYEKADQIAPGDTSKVGQLIVEVLTKSGRCEGKSIPLKLLLGSDAVHYADIIAETRQKEMDEWREISIQTNCDGYNEKPYTYKG